MQKVVEDLDEFKAYLASQPLCRWAAQKQREIAAGKHQGHSNSAIHRPVPKNDNSELADALSSMA
jgi:hypothetical protein